MYHQVAPVTLGVTSQRAIFQPRARVMRPRKRLLIGIRLISWQGKRIPDTTRPLDLILCSFHTNKLLSSNPKPNIVGADQGHPRGGGAKTQNPKPETRSG